MKQTKQHCRDGRKRSYCCEQSNDPLVPQLLAGESYNLDKRPEEQERDREVDDYDVESTEHRCE